MGCSQCQSDIIVGAKYCDICGHQLTVSSSGPLSTEAVSEWIPLTGLIPTSDASLPTTPQMSKQADKISCPACGRENLADSNWCDVCGATLK